MGAEFGRRRELNNLFSSRAGHRNQQRTIAMLVQLLRLSSLIQADKKGLALISSACEALSKGPATVDELWPGRDEHSLSS